MIHLTLSGSRWFPFKTLDHVTMNIVLLLPNTMKLLRGYLFFSVKDRNLFNRVDTIGNIFMSGFATGENITDCVHEMK